MKISLISNPPYNLKWKHPMFAQIQPRFSECNLPPENNANFAFVLTALSQVTDKAVFLLPNGVLTNNNETEQNIKKYLVEKNYIESIIQCPRNMFESTDISTSIIVLNKNKTTTNIMFIDMRQTHGEENRLQNAQFGGNSKIKRTYAKKVNIFRSEDIEKAIKSIHNKLNIPMFSKCASIEMLRKNDYSLVPSTYIEFKLKTAKHRDLKDIINDITYISNEKNLLKLTINEALAKQLGLIEVYETQKELVINLDEIKKCFSQSNSIPKPNFIVLSKNKNEIKFENNSKEKISNIFMTIFQMWKQHIHYLNSEENRYLMELRDAALSNLMNETE